MKGNRRVLGTSKITRTFQITVIKTARDELDVEIGDFILFVVEDGKLIIEKCS